MSERKPATILAGARTDKDPGLNGVVPPLWASDTFRWPTAEDKTRAAASEMAATVLATHMPRTEAH